MKRVIWKYVLKLTDEQRIRMPDEAEVLSFQMQAGQLCIWCLVNPEAGEVNRAFKIHGTGHHNIMPYEKYVGSVVDEQTASVWHLFDCGEF